MRFAALLFCVLISVPFMSAQRYTVSGKVIDKTTGARLPFATIRVAGKPNGATANSEGVFELKLPEGSYNLIASCMGYTSDSINVPLTKNKHMDFQLAQIFIHLPGVTITPGMNPANAIIEKAIAQKKIRNNNLHSYIYYATSKAVIRAPEEFSLGDNSASVSLGYSDTSQMKIGAIFENQSKGFVKKPDKQKEEIIARKQTANLPSNINTLTGGRVIQNFYSDDIKFFNTSMVSPLADGALSYYYFYILDTLRIDTEAVYKIRMSPADTLDPGFIGDIYIEGSSYNLKQVDLRLNRIANSGGLFDTIKIVQQFLPFGDQNIYMPVDYRLMIGIRYFKLFKLKLDIQSVLYEYEMNPPISDDLFTKAVITVSTSADKKDSTYWSSVQGIASSQEESAAYKEIDSISTINKTKKASFSPFAFSYALNDTYSLPAPLGMYRFNRVEGHTLMSSFSASGLFDERFRTNITSDYGFSDKRWKGTLAADYRLGDYRTTHLSLHLYRDLIMQFGHHIAMNQLINSAITLCSYFETDNYLYRDGFSFNAESEIFPVLSLNAGYTSNKDQTAFTSSPPPVLHKSKQSYNANNAIYDGTYRFLELGLKFDFRDYIEDGMYREESVGEMQYRS